MNEAEALNLRGVGLDIGGRTILDGIDWTVHAGGCAALLGPNGCGKSTLARTIAGYQWPTRGEVTVLGFRFGNASILELRRHLRLVQSGGRNDAPPTLTAKQVVLSGFFGTSGLFDETTEPQNTFADALLEQVGIAEIRENQFGTMSAGERVRCLIARALTGDPQLLLLDEPTAGLDLAGREQVLRLIEDLSSAGKNIVFTTHHLEEIPAATTDVLLLRHGQTVASGKPTQVLTSAHLSMAFGMPIEVEQNRGRFRAWMKA